MRSFVCVGAALCAATVAIAHDGVMNKSVLTRMETMTEFKEITKTLGRIGSGADEWDPKKVEITMQALTAAAARVVPEFEANERDPKDRAADTIWTSWDDFVSTANGFETTVSEMDVSSAKALAVSVSALGDGCKTCHKAYRVRK